MSQSWSGVAAVTTADRSFLTHHNQYAQRSQSYHYLIRHTRRLRTKTAAIRARRRPRRPAPGPSFAGKGRNRPRPESRTGRSERVAGFSCRPGPQSMVPLSVITGCPSGPVRRVGFRPPGTAGVRFAAVERRAKGITSTGSLPRAPRRSTSFGVTTITCRFEAAATMRSRVRRRPSP